MRRRPIVRYSQQRHIHTQAHIQRHTRSHRATLAIIYLKRQTRLSYLIIYMWFFIYPQISARVTLLRKMHFPTAENVIFIYTYIST